MTMLLDVLVVDDEVQVQTLFRKALGRKEYIVATAGNATEALSKVAENKYHVAILDLKLPDLTRSGMLLNSMLDKLVL